MKHTKKHTHYTTAFCVTFSFLILFFCYQKTFGDYQNMSSDLQDILQKSELQTLENAHDIRFINELTLDKNNLNIQKQDWNKRINALHNKALSLLKEKQDIENVIQKKLAPPEHIKVLQKRLHAIDETIRYIKRRGNIMGYLYQYIEKPSLIESIKTSLFGKKNKPTEFEKAKNNLKKYINEPLYTIKESDKKITKTQWNNDKITDLPKYLEAKWFQNKMELPALKQAPILLQNNYLQKKIMGMKSNGTHVARLAWGTFGTLGFGLSNFSKAEKSSLQFA